MKAIVVGSGPGGSTAAMVLAEGGVDFAVMEKGANSFGDLSSENPETTWSNDDLKRFRNFCHPDPSAEPPTYRWSETELRPRYVGQVQALAQTVGGGTVHWGADTPRFWDIDFAKLSMLGALPDSDVSDWPFSYPDIAPYYNEVEQLIGVAGDVQALPELVLGHAPRDRALPMPAGPPQYSSLVAEKGYLRTAIAAYRKLNLTGPCAERVSGAAEAGLAPQQKAASRAGRMLTKLEPP